MSYSLLLYLMALFDDFFVF